MAILLHHRTHALRIRPKDQRDMDTERAELSLGSDSDMRNKKEERPPTLLLLIHKFPAEKTGSSSAVVYASTKLSMTQQVASELPAW